MENRKQHVRFAGKVSVDGTVGDPSNASNIFDGRPMKALVGKHLGGGIKDLLAPGSRHQFLYGIRRLGHSCVRLSERLIPLVRNFFESALHRLESALSVSRDFLFCDDIEYSCLERGGGVKMPNFHACLILSKRSQSRFNNIIWQHLGYSQGIFR